MIGETGQSRELDNDVRATKCMRIVNLLKYLGNLRCNNHSRTFDRYVVVVDLVGYLREPFIELGVELG